MKKTYSLSKQEQSYYCIPAVIQAILRGRDKELSQRQIAEKINCTENGVTFGENLIPFFREYGLSFHYNNYNEIPFNDLGMFLDLEILDSPDIMVGRGENLGKLHILLMDSFEHNRVSLVNPYTLQASSIHFEDLFKQMWENKCGGFGIVRSMKPKVDIKKKK